MLSQLGPLFFCGYYRMVMLWLDMYNSNLSTLKARKKLRKNCVYATAMKACTTNSP